MDKYARTDRYGATTADRTNGHQHNSADGHWRADYGRTNRGVAADIAAKPATAAADPDGN